jgi:uncharacterized protein
VGFFVGLVAGLLIAAGSAAAVSSLAAAPMDDGQPFQSLLEVRRNNVIVQKWDLSCGAAVLARYTYVSVQ